MGKKFENLLVYISKKPLTSLGIFLFIPFPILYSFGSGIFDHWPFNSQVLAALAMLGLVIMCFGDKYEDKKNKDE